jgi:hypothetical protein
MTNQENEYSMKCNNCYLQFNYFGMSEKIHCPCCNYLMDMTMNRYDEHTQAQNDLKQEKPEDSRSSR